MLAMDPLVACVALRVHIIRGVPARRVHAIPVVRGVDPRGVSRAHLGGGGRRPDVREVHVTEVERLARHGDLRPRAADSIPQRTIRYDGQMNEQPQIRIGM